MGFVALWLGSGTLGAQANPVRAILFYSPTCPHCHQVIRDDLPRFFARFGGEPRFHRGAAGHLLTNGRLEILLVDATQAEGYAAYQAHTRASALPPERQGVPRLVCGDSVLVGSLEIPERFPEMVARGLAQSGVDWPRIENLNALFPSDYRPVDVAEAADSGPVAAPSADTTPMAPGKPDPVPRATLAPPPARSPAAAEPTARPAPPATEPTTEPTTESPAPPVAADVLFESSPAGSVLMRTLRTDPVGGSAALLVLAGTVAVLVWALAGSHREAHRPVAGVAVPILVALGTVTAGYLTYVEASGAAAVCGPIGDCNAVQHSPYARVLGLPVAGLGLVGYLAVLTAWVVARSASGPARALAARAAFRLALAGTAASAVLTALEPFVIGAVCAWCLGSAVVMTALLAVLAPARNRGPRRDPARS
jgi:uncharacterized membrane protein